MAKMTLKDVELNGKKVLMRVDFNVPIEDGRITDDNRIVQAMPSITYAAEQGALVILTSHLGRPKGAFDDSLSLRPVAEYLKENLDQTVHFASDCIGSEAEQVIESAHYGEVVLLENVRFHEGEKANEEDFCRQLAAHGDLFVNDAFGSSHRAHSSVAGVARYLQPAVSGFLLEKEITYLDKHVNHPNHPFVAVLGGAKVSDKIGVIENLLDKVDTILVGGGMTYTFYKAMEIPVGDSLVEEEKVNLAGELIDKAKEAGVNLKLPDDSVVAEEMSEDAEYKVVDREGIEEGWMGLDIGPDTVEAYNEQIKEAETVVWNGPMGVFEIEHFAQGTFSIAEAIASATKEGAISIIGGGDSASAIRRAGLENEVSHVSTGGGASLMFLEGKELPGVAALTDQ